MREQIRLWFYSQFFMSVVLVGHASYKRVLGYEKMLDEHGRRDARLVGEHDRGRRRVRADGRGRDALAVLRAAAGPNLLFGFGPAHEIKRKLLTFWNSVKFLVDYGNIEGFTPSLEDLDGGPMSSCARWTGGWSSARSNSSPRRRMRTRRR